MKTITTEMSDAIAIRVEAAFTERYQEKVNNPLFDQSKEMSESNPLQIDNPESRWDCTCKAVNKFIMDQVLSFEGRQVQQTAYDEKAQEIKGLNITTS